MIDAVCPRAQSGPDVKAICGVLTAVGFSSPPAWLKPYRALSNGQQFRCDLARALLASSPLVVFDEFTSVVDRQVAKVGSAAVAKAVRKRHVGAERFVAVACHYDILEWLQPDWILDLATGRVTRRRLRRPDIRLDVHAGNRAAWPLFKKHHYLSGNLAASCRCYYALANGELCGFVATINQLGHRGDAWRRVSRIVVLPDYQGVGIGGRLLDAVAPRVVRRRRRPSRRRTIPRRPARRRPLRLRRERRHVRILKHSAFRTPQSRTLPCPER